MCSCVHVFERQRGAAGGSPPGLRMRSPARWAGCPVVLGPMASSPTHCANCVRSVQTVATKSEVEARCARWPWALRSSASHRRPGGDPPAALDRVVVREADPLRAVLHLTASRTPLRCPAEDGGEANPGSKGGARSQTGRGTWTDSLPRRPRPRADATQVNGRYAPPPAVGVAKGDAAQAADVDLRCRAALAPKLPRYQRENTLGALKPSSAATSVSGRSVPST